MADAVVLAKVVGRARVDSALQAAAMAGRFAPGDLESVTDPAKRPPTVGARQFTAARHWRMGWPRQPRRS